MMTAKECMERRMRAHEAIEAVKKEWKDGKPDAAQREAFDRLYEEWRQARGDEELAVRMREIDSTPADAADDELRRKQATRTKRRELAAPEIEYHARQALRGWLRCRATGADPARQAVESAAAVGFDLAAAEIRIDPAWLTAERRELDITNAGKGLETIPEGFLRTLYSSMKAYSPLRQFCRVVPTSGTGALPIPVADDVANAAAIEAESPAAPLVGVDPTFGAVTLLSYKYKTACFLTRELTEDSGFPIETWVSEQLGTRMGRGQNAHFTTGNNAGQPAGYVWRATQNANAIQTIAVAGGLTYGKVLDVIHKLDPAYRSLPSTRLSFHDSFLKQIRSILSTSGDPVFQENARVGAPATIFGYEFFINQAMDDAATMSAGEEFVAFGAMAYHVIRDAGEIYLRVLRERYADEDLVCVVMRQRSDSDTATGDLWTTPPIIVGQGV